MIKKFTLLLLLTLSISGNLYSQYDVWTMECSTRPLTSINFISSTRALIFGGYPLSYEGNIMYKSTNHGANWSLPIFQNISIGGTYGASFQTLCFVDSMYGWACLDYTSIAKTTNGAESWSTYNVGLQSSRINGINFINRNTGWITGRDSYDYNLIARTSNGGLNWNVICSNLRFEPGQIYMLNENKGYAISTLLHSPWDSVASTTDGGYNWNYFRAGDPTGQPVNKVLFIDSLHGWLLGYLHYVSRTTDGGIVWTFCSNQIGNTTNMFFMNTLTGWITTPAGEIYRSTDGGIIWFRQRNPDPFASYEVESFTFDVFFKNEFTGWALVGNGTVLKSTNSGNNWYEEISPPLGNIKFIDFISSNIGFALSNYSNYVNFSYLYKTSNSGYNWNLIYSLTNSNLNSLTFLTDQMGFICGNTGNILKTTNGGINWHSMMVGSNNYYSIHFIDVNTGYCCGSVGTIIKTTNGGLNWLNQTSNSSYNLNNIYFADYQEGFVAADNGYVLKTTNSGLNWIPFHLDNYHSWIKVYFVNTTTGFVIGRSSNFPYSDRVLLKTTDAGSNWSHRIDEGGTGYYSFNDIYFKDVLTGWCCGSGGAIRKTTNGGDNWFSEQSTINSSLNSICFINNDFGWIGGEYGTVLTTAQPIGIQKTSSDIPAKFSLSQNYPNPFNPTTKIKFEITSNGKRETSNVRLIIYDILGREVATLVNEQLKPGSYEVDWDGSTYASGIYFYRLEAGDYIVTKKMALIK